VFVFLCLCTGRSLDTSWSSVQGVIDLVTEVKRKVSCRWPSPKLGCRVKGKKKSFSDCSVQCIKFLLALVSRFSWFRNTSAPMTIFFVLSKTFNCFEMGLPIWREKESITGHSASVGEWICWSSFSQSFTLSDWFSQLLLAWIYVLDF
jgi:hypothetical protein